MSSGRCIAEAEILFAAPGAADAGICEKQSPCSLTHAAAIADPTRFTIKLAAGSYSASLLFTNKVVVIHGVGATVSAPTGEPFEVENGGRLRLVGLTVFSQGNTSSALRCENAAPNTPTLELFRVTVDATNNAIFAFPCMLSIEQSTLRSRKDTSSALMVVTPSVANVNRTFFDGGAGISNIDATVKITNTVFKRVGRTTNGAVEGSGIYEIAFATIVDTYLKCGTAGASALTLNSSIVHDTAATATEVLQGTGWGTGCAITHSLIYPTQVAAGATNQNDLPRLKDVSLDDYHLTSQSPAIDLADLAATVPVDFDGASRPQGMGRDSGAFEYKP